MLKDGKSGYRPDCQPAAGCLATAALSEQARAVTVPQQVSGINSTWWFYSAIWHLLAHLCLRSLIDIAILLVFFLNDLKIVFFFVSLAFTKQSCDNFPFGDKSP